MSSFDDYAVALPRQKLSDIDDAADHVSDPEKEGLQADIIDLTEVDDPSSHNPSLTPTPHFKRPRNTAGNYGRYNHFGLRVHRKVDKDGDALGTSVVIASAPIKQALLSLVRGYASINPAAHPIIIKEPYEPLFHYRAELLQYAKDPSLPDFARQHMQVFVNKFLNEFFEDALKIRANSISQGFIPFDHLWTLFRAEDDILHVKQNYKQIHRIISTEITTTADDSTIFRIRTWRWDYSNKKFGPCLENIDIVKFSTERPITHLPCYPLKVLTDNDQQKIREECIARGRRWRQLIVPSHKRYSGPMWQVNGDALGVVHMDGRIMLDAQTFEEECASQRDDLFGSSRYQLRKEMSDSLLPRQVSEKSILYNNIVCYDDEASYEITDDQALLSPARVRGFSLASKTFGSFLVDLVEDITYDDDAFGHLSMNDEWKNILKNLVEAHHIDQSGSDDIISGKGRGLVASLEGPPGCGKTLTAESIADYTHRPLYAISTSELEGNWNQDTERVIRDVFRRAEKWKAVVLIDEADVVLTKRSMHHFSRNSLATVFLRNLEYFKGLMFLTTNRVEAIDSAFRSRIHLRLPYNEPDLATRTAIWKRFLPASTAASICEDLAALEINGREIKNLARTASLLANAKAGFISVQDVKTIHSLNAAQLALGGDNVEEPNANDISVYL